MGGTGKAKPFLRGKTYFQGHTPPTDSQYGVEVGLEGSEHIFPDIDETNTEQHQVLRSQRDVRAIVVRNTSGVNLLPKLAVTWASGQRGKRVDGYSRTTGTEIAGVVDPMLPAAGVADNDLFYLIVEGPVIMKTDPGNATDIAIGDIAYALTAAASTHSTTAGRPQFHIAAGTFTATQSTDGTIGQVVLGKFGRAMSAMTSGNDDADILVDLKIT